MSDGKNIVLCLDGTGNEYGKKATNVLKFVSLLPDSSSRQIAWYDPGVGTSSLPRLFTKIPRAIKKVLGLAFGYGITDNIADAYLYLMNTYRPGDRVFIFGFSRGAYTARAVAGMIRKVGLLEYRNENLIPYAVRMFRFEKDCRIYAGFRDTFSRRCPVHFLGLWDTVKSVGWQPKTWRLPFTMTNNIVSVVRHAVAIDERRCYYRQNLWGKQLKNQDVKQVWFAGSHSDVGGSYDKKACGLPRIALKWIVDEAARFDLEVDQKRYDSVFSVEEASAESEESSVQPDYKGQLHKSLKGLWWILEIFPIRYADIHDNYKEKIRIPLGRRRYIKEGAFVHESVKHRLDDPECNYKPENLPADCNVYNARQNSSRI